MGVKNLQKKLNLLEADIASHQVTFFRYKVKGRISERVSQENKALQVFRKTKKRTCAYQGVWNVRFFGKFGVFCFLETPVSRFAHLPYYQRYMFTVLNAC